MHLCIVPFHMRLTKAIKCHITYFFKAIFFTSSQKSCYCNAYMYTCILKLTLKNAIEACLYIFVYLYIWNLRRIQRFWIGHVIQLRTANVWKLKSNLRLNSLVDKSPKILLFEFVSSAYDDIIEWVTICMSYS